MNEHRRRFIRVLGSAGVIAAPLLPGCAPMPEEALEAWRRAGRDADPRRRLLSWAILAPSPHNQQPWLVDLRNDDEILLYCDPARLLPMTDPPGRQVLIGHGCFLELLSQAAAADGQRADIALFPEGEPGPAQLDSRPVARVRLSPRPPALDPLFEQVLRRNTYKKPFDGDRPVPEPALAALLAAAERPGVETASTQRRDMVDELNRIVVAAWEVEQTTPRTWKESVDLTRVGAAEIVAHRDGVSLGGTMIEALRLLGQLTPQKAMDPDSLYFSSALKRVREWAPATGTFAWLKTRADSRAAQVEAGRAFVRLQLKAAELGLVTQPPSQVLQEFSEMDALRARFERLVGQRAGEKVQMLVRIGYPAQDKVPSPRRPLESFVRA
jgi:nitroreductase